jgi:serine/threonine protein kinase/formylglycine-generating enzyme required for sulfatase activity
MFGPHPGDVAMSDNDSSVADPFGQIADEFVKAFRQGQDPSVEEFARRYPEHAAEIREMLPALVLIEKARAAEASDQQRQAAAAVPLQQLGDYQILREIGRGGMGVVYEAQQLSLGRHVAIKVLPSHALLDPRHLGRFEREARSAAKLHHTNIVPVFGVGEQDGLHYYVMQLIPGLGLDVVLDELRRLRQPRGKQAPNRGDAPGRRTNVTGDVSAVAVARSLLTGQFRQPEPDGEVTTAPGEPAAEADLGVSAPARAADTSATIRLPGQGEGSTLSESGSQYWQSVARVGVQVADALAHASGQGVLHRDIKPANLLLDDTGNVWVTDFGLAKADSDGDNLTHTGDIVGTLRYMAPERFNGQGDLRSDVYSLGLTLYEMLVLRPAFDETDRNKLVKQVMHDEPPRPRSLAPSLPRDLETVVLKAIARDPAHRYQSAGALADDLQRFLDGRPITARPVGPIERSVKWVKRNPVVTAAALAVLLALSLGTTVSTLKYLDAEQQKGIAEERRKDAVEQTEIAEARRKDADQQKGIALEEARRAKRARDFLVSIFELSDANGIRGTMTARQILEDAEKRIPVDFADQPELRADLLEAVETVFAKITENAPLAMLLEVRGTVRLQSARNPKQRAVPQALLYSGDRLSLADDASVQLVSLSDLHKEWLKPNHEVTIRRKGCEPAEAVQERDNSVLMPFVRLPKGTFYMGWDGKKKGVKTEIKEDFEIAAHLVTQGQWVAVMGHNPSGFARFGTSWTWVKDISDEELKIFPVESVSWDDAQRFITKLNEKESGRGYLYRLPTEAEWEYACRGGATSEDGCSFNFYFDKPTNDLSSERANIMDYLPTGLPKGLFRTTRVGAYPTNKLGLCDMHGNVFEWCANLYLLGEDKPPVRRVFRGGCWGGDSSFARAASCQGDMPWSALANRGFRLARVPVRPR